MILKKTMIDILKGSLDEKKNSIVFHEKPLTLN